MNYGYSQQGKYFQSKHVATQKQIADIRRVLLDDGREKGSRVAIVSNGSGLEFEVLLDRALDIGRASFRGVPLAFLTPVGFSHPSYYDPQGLGWLRNWGGGLLTGCGLRNAGSPSSAEDEEFGLHGRLSNTPAENCASSCKWINDEYILSITGVARQSRMFGENLELTRKISVAAGKNEILIEDSIENCASKPSPLMLLYHINLGYPLLSESSILEAPEHKVVPRDDIAETGIKDWHKCLPPTHGWEEQCFYHDLPEDQYGFASISMSNKELGIKLTVSHRKNELPNLIQWKQMGQGEYVMGLEPANCHPEGLTKEREKGSLKEIEPGETVNTSVKISLTDLS